MPAFENDCNKCNFLFFQIKLMVWNLYLTSIPGDFINGVTLSYVVKQPSHIGQKSDPTTAHRHHH